MVLPTIKWKCNSDDDFVGVCEGWILRVEQMDKDYWWWSLSKFIGTHGKNYVYTDLEFDFPVARSMNEAIDFATTSFYFHYLETTLLTTKK